MKRDPEKRWLKSVLPAAQAYSHAVVYSELVFFLNPKNRGPNWEWSHFADLCERTAVTSAYSCFSIRDWNKYRERILECVRENTRRNARETLTRSGLYESEV